MLRQHVCQVRYHAFSEDRVNQFKVEPLHFFEHGGGLYAYVRTPKHGDVITLAVERIVELTVTDQAFAYPEDFDPQTRLAQAFGVTSDAPVRVRIRFSRDQARSIQERRWAAEQRIMENEDGSIILDMTTSGLWEIARWVLSWGGDAEVLEPDELREMVAGEVDRMAGVYRQCRGKAVGGPRQRDGKRWQGQYVGSIPRSANSPRQRQPPQRLLDRKEINAYVNVSHHLFSPVGSPPMPEASCRHCPP